MTEPLWTSVTAKRSIFPSRCERPRARRLSISSAHVHSANRYPPAGTCAREDIMGKSKNRGRTPSLEAVAGNGLLNRRALLGSGIALAGAMGVGGATSAAAEPLKDDAWSQ